MTLQYMDMVNIFILFMLSAFVITSYIIYLILHLYGSIKNHFYILLVKEKINKIKTQEESARHQARLQDGHVLRPEAQTCTLLF